MTDKEAMQALIDGKKVRSMKWERGEYVELDNNGQIINCEQVFTVLGSYGAKWQIYESREDKMEKLAGRLKHLLFEGETPSRVCQTAMELTDLILEEKE